MASLLLSASPWESSSPAVKKKATMKKLVYGKKNNTLTRPPPPPQPHNEDEEEEEEETVNVELDLKPRFSSDMDKNTERNAAVHNHIKNMAVSAPNAGDFLAEFKPLSANPLLPNPPLQRQQQQQPTSYKEAFSQNNPTPTSSGDKYSNYNAVYTPQQSAPYYARMGLGDSSNSAGGNNDKLMEKINYLIHLLEEQQSEKTNYVTEEFLLYGFLGIFMIFIVDSFSRAGKYVR